MKGADMKRCPTPRFLAVVVAALCTMLFAVSVFAQFQTGNIYGKVQAKDGSVLPGVTVTLTGIGAPQTTVTDAQGNFRFVSLSPGSYTLKAGTGINVPSVELQNIPTGRDPWVIMQQTPGVLLDRVNVGGSESGQQSGYVSKGTDSAQSAWNVDGVSITDVGALGSTPTYYDFDSFEEMQITTGGSDPRIKTPGIQMNFVTKRGTNDFKGSGRWFQENNSWQAKPSIPSEAPYLLRVNQITR